MFKPLKNNEEILTTARDAYQQVIDGWREDDEASRKDLEFRRNEHWSKSALASRGTERPAFTFNVLDRFVDRLTGEAEANPIEIEVLPVDDRVDILTAFVTGGILKAIQYDSASMEAVLWAAECAASCGRGYYGVTREYAHDMSMDRVLRVRRLWDPLMVRPDPNHYNQDLSDACYCLILQPYTPHQFEQTFGKDKALGDFDMVDNETAQNWYTRSSQDAKSVKNYLVAEFLWKEAYSYRIGELADTGQTLRLIKDPETLEGDTRTNEQGLESVFLGGDWWPLSRTRKVRTNKVFSVIMAGHAVLSPKEEWIDKELPVYGIYGKQIVGDGKRSIKSAIRNGIDSQKLVNTMYTSSAEVVAASSKAPWLAPFNAVKAHQKRWEKANDPTTTVLFWDPVPELPNGGKPERAVPGVEVSAQFVAATQALDVLNFTLGMPSAMMGEKSNERTGRAIVARSREGALSTSWLPAQIRASIISAGKDLLRMIPKVYRGSRVVQAILEDLADKSKPVNLGINGASVPGQADLLMEAFRKLEIDPGELDLSTVALEPSEYNVVVTTKPAHATRRIEASEVISQVFPGMPPEIQALLVPHLLDYMDVPGMREVVQQVKEFNLQGPVAPQAIEAVAIGLLQSPEFLQALAQALLQGQQGSFPSPGGRGNGRAPGRNVSPNA